MFLLWKVNTITVTAEGTRQSSITLFVCFLFWFHHSLSLSHKNTKNRQTTVWYIQRCLLSYKTNAFTDNIFFALGCLCVLVTFCVWKVWKAHKSIWLSENCWNVTTIPDEWYNMIFFWWIDPVSIHKTPSPILRQADRGRAVTHEYSSDLRQEMIYHPRWAGLTWLTASGDSTQRERQLICYYWKSVTCVLQ